MTERDARRALQDARRRLDLAGVSDPARDASALLEAAGAGAADRLPPDVAARFEHLVARRVRREPVSHLTGRRAFWMHDFIVTPDVLDPRPDTETLVETARDVLRDAGAPRLLDLGTGSGCILLSLLHELPGATGIGTDISSAALDVAWRNADRVGVADRVTFGQADWLRGVAGRFDLIVSNPPYIAEAEMADLQPEVRDWEPHLALTPGGDGLAAYRILARDAPAHLGPGGWLMAEIGHRQAAAVTALWRQAGLTRIGVTRDLNGRDRVVSGQKAAR
ncbi:MAG: peptide chain release factor N(5)-glutamine methyltransferase [Pseudomonadota bacterium]